MSYEPFRYCDNKASAKQLLSSSTRWSKRKTFYSQAYPNWSTGWSARWSARALALLILLSVNLVVIICFIAISMYSKYPIESVSRGNYEYSSASLIKLEFLADMALFLSRHECRGTRTGGCSDPGCSG